MSAIVPWPRPRTRRVALSLDHALSDWLAGQLRTLRPDLRLVDAPPCELAICLECPREEPAHTTLWIAQVERLPYLMRLSPRIWRLSPPFTPTRLQGILAEILG